MKWNRNEHTGTYRYGETNYNVKKTPSGRITKSYGWDLYEGNKKVAHFEKLADAKKFAENM